jgi:gluconate 5-dehydrogenase
MSAGSAFSLQGKTALIAGASRGIGQAIAEHVARAGARTLIAARSLGPLAEIARQLRGEGAEVEVLETDISDAQSREDALAELPEVDILVNVAGTNIRKRFEDYTPLETERIMNVNLNGLVELTRSVGKRMIARVDEGKSSGGKIIFIGSLTTLIGLPYVSVYAMTKSAMGGLTRTLAAEWGRYNIQVNCIAPGFILTDLNRKMWEPEQMQTWLKSVQPTQRMGTPEDIAPLAVYLASPGSDYVTGQVISVDGGISTTAMWPFQP